MAALDLHTGELVADVGLWHRSVEFIALLQRLVAYYPPGSTIRVMLGNHSSHISKETTSYLASYHGHFE